MQCEKENLAELEWDTKQRVLEDTNLTNVAHGRRHLCSEFSA